MSDILTSSRLSLKLVYSNKINLSLFIIKTTILALFFLFLLVQVEPFGDISTDNAVLILEAINIVDNGSFGHTNELLQETGRWEFVPLQYVKTVHDTHVPYFMPGFSALMAVFYFFGGFTGLFYASVIFSMLVLIFTERIASILFGKFVGLFVLILMVSDPQFLLFSVIREYDISFVLFFIIGCFFLIRFFQNQGNKNLFLASTFFVICALLRINGIIFLPLEIILVGFYFIIKKYKNRNLTNSNKKNFFQSSFSNIFKKNGIKTIMCLAIPMLLFSLIFLGYNQYYFGDPLIYYENVPQPNPIFKADTPRLNPLKYFEYNEEKVIKLKFFEKNLLPRSIIDFFNSVDQAFGSDLERNWIWILPNFIILPALYVAYKQKRPEIFVFASFIYFHLFFFTNAIGAVKGGYDYAIRYQLYLYPIFYMILGFLIFSIFNSKKVKLISISKPKLRIIILGLVLLLILVILITHLNYFLTDFNKKFQGKSITNPADNWKFPRADMTVLSKNSVMVERNGWQTVEMGMIPFNPYKGLNTREGLPEELNEESIRILRRTVADGYDVFIKKNPGFIKVEKPFYLRLVNDYGFGLLNHSKEYCKLILVNEGNRITIPITEEMIKTSKNMFDNQNFNNQKDSGTSSNANLYLNLKSLGLTHDEYIVRIFYEDISKSTMLVKLFGKNSNVAEPEKVKDFKIITNDSGDMREAFEFAFNYEDLEKFEDVYLDITSKQGKALHVKKITITENTPQSQTCWFPQ